MNIVSFYSWLRTNKSMPLEAKPVYSRMIRGYSDLPIEIYHEKQCVTKNESARLIQMEHYVNAYTMVEDKTFDVMLSDRRLRLYQKLANEYLAVDGGIASDLREDGWRAVAQNIAYNRNRQIPKLKNCIIKKQSAELTLE